MPRWYYRYPDDPTEITQIKDERKIQNMSVAAGALTYYSPTRYSNVGHAQRDLALPSPPTHRVGPVPEPVMPTFRVPLRIVGAANGQPGGGLEAATQDEVWLGGLWDFASGGKWEL